MTKTIANVVSMIVTTLAVALVSIAIGPQHVDNVEKPIEINEFQPTELPACLTDEGESAFACYWDSERGTGEGISFWIDGNNNVHELG